jgi:hypothetical protein
MTLCSFDTGTKKCKIDKLYGEWIFINLFEGKLTNIDSLKKDVFKSNDGPPIWTYKKNGTYINDQGDYTTVGKFKVDTENCMIKTFDDNGELGDTSTVEITYLDNNYLLEVLVDNPQYTYFYKRKK